MTIINVTYQHRANDDYQKDITDISQFYASILKNNSEDQILELLPIIEQKIINISPHELAILINYNALLEPMSQTSILVKDSTINENLVKNLEIMIRKRLKKKRENTILNIPANMLLFVIYYADAQAIKYTILGYKNSVFFKSYKFSLILFYLIFFLIHLLLLLRFAWLYFFKNKNLYQLNEKIKTRNLKNYQLKKQQNKTSTTFFKNNFKKKLKNTIVHSSANSLTATQSWPEKIKLTHPEIRSLEKILVDDNNSSKKISTILIKMFSQYIVEKKLSNIIKVLLAETFNLQEKKNYKLYQHNENNPHSYQLIYYQDWRSGRKDPQQITDNKIDLLLLTEGEILLNGYPILIEEEKNYRYFFPLLLHADLLANRPLKEVKFLLEIISYRPIINKNYQNTFMMSSLLLKSIQHQKDFQQYKKIEWSYLKKWLACHFSYLKQLKIDAFLMMIKILPHPPKKKFDTHDFISLLIKIKNDRSLKKNEIVFFYDYHLESFLGLVLGTDEQELQEFKYFLTEQISLRFKFSTLQQPTNPMNIVEKVKQSSKVLLQPLVNRDIIEDNIEEALSKLKSEENNPDI